MSGFCAKLRGLRSPWGPWFGTQTRSKVRRWELFQRQNGRCYWCKDPMTPWAKLGEVEAIPPSMVTLDHIYAKGDPRRQMAFHDGMHVAACWRCNNDRSKYQYTGKRRVAEIPERFLLPSVAFSEAAE